MKRLKSLPATSKVYKKKKIVSETAFSYIHSLMDNGPHANGCKRQKGVSHVPKIPLSLQSGMVSQRLCIAV